MTTAMKVQSLLYFGTSSGELAYDTDGVVPGNPFATSLIEVVGRSALTLDELGYEVKRLTSQRTGGLQVPDIPKISVPMQIFPSGSDSRYIALLLVYSDYSQGGFNSLPGALHDAARLSAALVQSGFSIQTETNPLMADIDSILKEFEVRSQSADVTLIYSTGHGVEVDRCVFLLPKDFPLSGGESALASDAIPISRLRDCARAKSLNMTFFAGCRNNPFRA